MKWYWFSGKEIWTNLLNGIIHCTDTGTLVNASSYWTDTGILVNEIIYSIGLKSMILSF